MIRHSQFTLLFSFLLAVPTAALAAPDST